MSEWFDIKERSAGKYRLYFLWIIYKVFGLTCLKGLLIPIVWCIWLFAKPVRKASSEYQKVLSQYCNRHSIKVKHFTTFAHIYSYACSLADKMSAICDNASPVKFKIIKNKSWKSFQELIRSDKGVFLISTHLGNIEAFCAFPNAGKSRAKKLHALMEVSQNSIFHNFVKERTQNKSFILHPAEQTNFHTVMTLYENLCEGDILLIAGDRISAENPNNTVTCKFLDKQCHFPLGTFRFAKSMKHKTFAIIALYIGNNTYEISLQQLDLSKDTNEIVRQYSKFIEKNITRYPTQWYNFYNYFDGNS